jgi:HD superfamily phosphohydrolase
MLKNALLNANKVTKNSFLKELKTAIVHIIEEENLNIPIGGGVAYFDNKALYQFTIPSKSKAQADSFTIILQAVRLVSLLHDVGHLPFSHQIENALKNVYTHINESSRHKSKEEAFVQLYKKVTQEEKKVLHEAIGDDLIDMLFDYELPHLLQNQNDEDYIKLVHKLVRLILDEKVYAGFDFAVLHKITSGTVDADRLDYINRDMVSSGYIGGPNDHLRITKHTVLVKDKEGYDISFLDMGLIDIEHMLEMRFNLYKKIIYNFGIAKTDALLENVVLYLSKKYFKSQKNASVSAIDSISMLWTVLQEKNTQKKLDIISMLDENWLISLFKKEYFKIKNKALQTQEDKKYLLCFEEVLFGKRFFKSPWKNLNEFYKELNFSTVERYKFRESFGFITPNKRKALRFELNNFVTKWENKKENLYFSYQIVSFNIGIEKDFTLFDGESLINLDEISTLRKRLKHSMLNTVPFYIYTNKKTLYPQMKEDLKDILFKVFTP